MSPWRAGRSKGGVSDERLGLRSQLHDGRSAAHDAMHWAWPDLQGIEGLAVGMAGCSLGVRRLAAIGSLGGER